MTSKQKLLQLAVKGTDYRDWYPRMTEHIHAVCSEEGVCPQQFIYSLAVLSPQVSVMQNFILAFGWWLCDEEPNVVRSVGVSFSRLRDSGYVRSAIRGPKTGRFADALMGDPDACVLDTHMGYALHVPATQLKNKGIQAEAEKRIGWVAYQLGWCMADTQAAIWAAQRHRAGHSPVYPTYEDLTGWRRIAVRRYGS